MFENHESQLSQIYKNCLRPFCHCKILEGDDADQHYLNVHKIPADWAKEANDFNMDAFYKPIRQKHEDFTDIQMHRASHLIGKLLSKYFK